MWQEKKKKNTNAQRDIAAQNVEMEWQRRNVKRHVKIQNTCGDK